MTKLLGVLLTYFGLGGVVCYGILYVVSDANYDWHYEDIVGIAFMILVIVGQCILPSIPTNE